MVYTLNGCFRYIIKCQYIIRYIILFDQGFKNANKEWLCGRYRSSFKISALPVTLVWVSIWDYHL